MKKIMLVFGTRPEAIKMAPLVKELKKNSDLFQTIVCVTAQHREMLDQVLNLFEIVPDYDLNIMHPNQDLFDISSRILLGLRDVLLKEIPDLVLVHGDTTTSSISALASYYMRIPVGHIEAGLRTNNIYSPFPEEMNRQITGRISAYHFAPTLGAKNNLLKENIDATKIYITGNTVIDALHWVVSKLNNDNALCKNIIHSKQFENYTFHKDRKIVLITGHRRENIGEGFVHICNAIKDLAIKYPKVDFIYPVHLNPNVQSTVKSILDNQYENIYLLKPLDYLPFVYLMKNSYIILTDSGGIQEEAPSLGIPVLVMRETTERPEAVEAGTVIMVGTDSTRIYEITSRLLDNKDYYLSFSQTINPYGDGTASKQIVQFIKHMNL